ncbi:MAG: ADP-ribosylglycohydrolase family protein [Thermoleophilia bacterium]
MGPPHPGARQVSPRGSVLNHQDAVRDRFVGCMLGTLLGDALGMPVEGMTASAIRYRHGSVRDLLDARLGRGTYTDDTEMTVALAESLVACRGFKAGHAASSFVGRLDRRRGYGRGTIEALERVAAGVPWESAGAHIYGSGSFGNGSAMRVGPVGLLFHRDLDLATQVAREQSDITHCHPLGRAGAAIMAAAVAVALRWGVELERPIDPSPFLELVGGGLEENEGLFGESLEKVKHMLRYCPAPAPGDTSAAQLGAAEQVAAVLGNDARAFHSVPTALYCFLANAGDPEQSLIHAVSLGGDTDTIAAMTGALAGAYCGAGLWPTRWLEHVETGPRGRDYIMGLADDLFLVWLELFSEVPLQPPALLV